VPYLSIPSASAIRASIATDLAPNFRMTLLRCMLTVTSLIESSTATCLLGDERHPVPFTSGEKRILLLQPSDVSEVLASVLTHSDRSGNCLKQILSPYRFEVARSYEVHS
jgi:hypothetical protein